MRKKLLRVAGVVAAVAMLVGVGTSSLAQQKKEKLVIYENFGGVDPSGEDGIIPDKWPAVHADSQPDGNGTGWRSRNEAVTGQGAVYPNGTFATVLAPQAGNNPVNLWRMFIDKPTLKDELDAAGVAIVGDSANNTFKYSVPLRNDYTANGGNTVGFKMFNMMVFPEFYNSLCYDSILAPGGVYATREGKNWVNSYSIPKNGKQFYCGKPDERGYLFFGGNLVPGHTGVEGTAMLTIPADSGHYLTNVSKVEVAFFGSRTADQNQLVAFVQHLDVAVDTVLSIDTFTFSSINYNPRTVTMNVKNGDNNKVRIKIRGTFGGREWDYTFRPAVTGDLTGNMLMLYPYNINIMTNAGGNRGMGVSHIKVYSIMAGTYEINKNGGATAIFNAAGDSITIEAPATNASSQPFAGWRISGRDDLSEVANPVTIAASEDLTITPLYAGDVATVPVVNESFINWEPEFKLATQLGDAKAGLIQYTNQAAFSATNDTYGRVNKTVKVPLHHGFRTPAGDDSVQVTLKYANVVPTSTIRTSNAPGAEQWRGFIGFGANSNTDKGYFEVDSLEGITKASVVLSTYDPRNTQLQGAVAVFENNELKRNLADLLFTQARKDDIVLTGSKAKFTIGYSNQAAHEFLVKGATVPDSIMFEGDWLQTTRWVPVPDTTLGGVNGDSIISGIRIKGTANAQYSAMHSLKMYAERTLTADPYYKLTTLATGGTVLATPEAGNSTNQYLSNTEVNLLATPNAGLSFDAWVDGNGNPVSSENPFSVVITQDTVLEATFVKNTTVTVRPHAHGSFTLVSPTEFPALEEKIGDTTMVFAASSDITLAAAPEFGWKFTSWVITENGNPFTVSTPVNQDTLRLNSADVKGRVLHVAPAFDSIQGRKTLTWTYDISKGFVEFDYLAEGEDIQGDVHTGKYPEGETVTVSVAAQLGYAFVRWEDGNANTIGTSSTIKVLMDVDKSIVPILHSTEYRLSALTVNDIDVAGFNSNATAADTFMVYVAPGSSTINIDATPTDAAATVAGLGVQNVAQGVRNDFTIEVTAESGATRKYNLAVFCEVALNSLTTSVGSLYPAFKQNTFAYTVLNKVPSGTTTVTFTASANDPGATVTGAGEVALKVGKNSYDIVVALGSVSKTYTVTIERENPTAVSAEQNVVSLYPNPVVSSDLNIESSELNGGETVEVYSISGALVATYQTAGSKSNINVSQLPNGTYLLKVGKYSAKFVKQ